MASMGLGHFSFINKAVIKGRREQQTALPNAHVSFHGLA